MKSTKKTMKSTEIRSNNKRNIGIGVIALSVILFLVYWFLIRESCISDEKECQDKCNEDVGQVSSKEECITKLKAGLLKSLKCGCDNCCAENDTTEICKKSDADKSADAEKVATSTCNLMFGSVGLGQKNAVPSQWSKYISMVKISKR